MRARRSNAHLVILITILVAIGMAGCGTPEVSDAPRPTTSGIAYGPDGQQVMDLFLPGPHEPGPLDDPTTRPAVVLVHGGGWTSGSRAAHHPLASKLADRGWVAASVDYRLAPDHGHPAAVEDVRAAVAHLHELASEIGVSPRHVVLAGESAGAHLAAMVALADESPDVAGLIAWSGLYELPELPERVVDTPHDWLLYHLWAYLGCDDLQDAACTATAQEASPVRLASENDPPSLLLHSSNELAPLEDAQTLHAALRRAGAPSRLEVVDGSAHGRALIEITDDVVTNFLEGLVRT